MPSVWYIGTSDRRIITSEEWAELGITAPDMVWDSTNGFSIPQSQFTASMLNILVAERRFDIDAPNGPRPTPTGYVPPTLPPPGPYNPPIGTGASAYDIAVKNGFVGNELEWLDSLSGGVTEAEVQTALTDHIIDTTPHPEYDDGVEITLIYENAKV